MNHTLALMPLVVPLATALISLWFRSFRSLQIGVAIAGHLLLLVTASVLVHQVWTTGTVVAELGDWAPPFGITVAIDLLGSAMVWVSAAIALTVSVYASGHIDEARRQSGFWPILSILIMGVNGAFVTGDLFNLYVWFEVLLMSSFVLLSIGNQRPQVEASVKYVAINLVSSSAFLIATAMLYGITGTLNMADLSVKIAQSESSGLVTTVAVVLTVAFGIKAAVFPLYFWLPSAYPSPPAAISGLFAALLSKVGVYSLLRCFTLLFHDDQVLAKSVLLWVSGATMIAGVLGALSQTVLRHAFSFHLIAAIGFMMMGIAILSEASLAATVFYLLVDMIVIAGLFLTAGVVERVTNTRDTRWMGGLYEQRPLLCFAYLIPALSVAGFPPMSGFWGKLGLLQATIDQGYFTMAGVALATSALALVSIGQIWSRAFWRPRSNLVGQPFRRMTIASAALAGITLLLGVFPGLLYDFTERAAADLARPQRYVEAVLSKRNSP